MNDTNRAVIWILPGAYYEVRIGSEPTYEEMARRVRERLLHLIAEHVFAPTVYHHPELRKLADLRTIEREIAAGDIDYCGEIAELLAASIVHRRRPSLCKNCPQKAEKQVDRVFYALIDTVERSIRRDFRTLNPNNWSGC